MMRDGTRIYTPTMSHTYTPAWWVPGAHLRTLWGKLLRRGPRVPMRAERWETPDGDFVDVRRVDAPAGAPRLLLFHGLEGAPHSHYVRGILGEAHRRGWGADLLVFRGCGGELNRARRFYHSGETSDAALFLDRIAGEHPESPLFLAGVSLGGNVLLKFLGERMAEMPTQVVAAAAVSVPFDLSRSSLHIDRGFSRVYQRHFLRSLRRKTLAKLQKIPDLVPAGALDGIATLYDFDDRITAPIHGFRDAADYYEQSSSIRWLERIRVPTLLLSAIDDPFLPPEVLDEVRRIAASNPALELEFVERGGHVGFVSGRFPWRPFYYAEWRVGDFFERCLRRG